MSDEAALRVVHGDRAMSSGTEPLWKVADVARFINASRSWVYQKAEAGELPCLRLGGLLRFEPETVRAWARGEPQPAARIVPLPRKAKP